MNRLQAEWQRLFLADPAAGEDSGLVSPDGAVRALVLELMRPADWNALARVWQGVQADLELPAPAIAVSGTDGYQLWFSLAEPVPASRARDFLEALRARYLAEIASKRLCLLPVVDEAAPGQVRHAHAVPALREPSGCWSAFVAPDLAPMFASDPWLDIPPSPDGQAELLARVRSMSHTDFEQALQKLTDDKAASDSAAVAAADGRASTEPGPADAGADPKRFLLGVMNDPGVALALRIEAAKALLPCCPTASRSPAS